MSPNAPLMRPIETTLEVALVALVASEVTWRPWLVIESASSARVSAATIAVAALAAPVKRPMLAASVETVAWLALVAATFTAPDEVRVPPETIATTPALCCTSASTRASVTPNPLRPKLVVEAVRGAVARGGDGHGSGGEHGRAQFGGRGSGEDRAREERVRR